MASLPLDPLWCREKTPRQSHHLTFRLQNLDNQAYIEFATDINDSTGDQEGVSQGRRQWSALDFELINPALFLAGRSAAEPAHEAANE